MFNKLVNFIFKFKKGEPFDPKLIAYYHDEHQKLVALALEIKEQAENGKHNDMLIKSMLKTLKVEIVMHFAHEDKTLYKYLNLLYKDDIENKALVEEFNFSMHKIEEAVEGFMDKYTAPDAQYDDTFREELDGIIDALAKRIDTEENHLYTLYNKKNKK